VDSQKWILGKRLGTGLQEYSLEFQFCCMACSKSISQAPTQLFVTYSAGKLWK